MNYNKAMLAGSFVWLLVITTFTVLSFIPVTKNAMMQGMIVVALMLFYSTAGAFLYYRNVTGDHGIRVGIWASATALLLDILITVPLFEIPNGGGYGQFFSTPILWVLVIINICTFCVFGKMKGSPRQSH